MSKQRAAVERPYTVDCNVIGASGAISVSVRIEERIIQEMIEQNLVVTEAIEEQVYVEVFNCPSAELPKLASDPASLFATCKMKLKGEVNAVCVLLIGEIACFPVGCEQKQFGTYE